MKMKKLETVMEEMSSHMAVVLPGQSHCTVLAIPLARLTEQLALKIG